MHVHCMLLIYTRMTDISKEGEVLKITIDYSPLSLNKDEAQVICDAFGIDNTLEDGDILDEVTFEVEDINSEISGVIKDMVNMCLKVTISS